MKKLELKHLAPYLPYGLKLLVERKSSFNNQHNSIKVEDWKITDLNAPFNRRYQVISCKPILRPFSDAIKSIDHLGKKVIVAKQLWSVDAIDEDGFETFGFIPDYWKRCLQQNPTDLDYHDVRILFEYHFDVFGLIKAGLAIDINTL